MAGGVPGRPRLFLDKTECSFLFLYPLFDNAGTPVVAYEAKSTLFCLRVTFFFCPHYLLPLQRAVLPHSILQLLLRTGNVLPFCRFAKNFL